MASHDAFPSDCFASLCSHCGSFSGHAVSLCGGFVSLWAFVVTSNRGSGPGALWPLRPSGLCPTDLFSNTSMPLLLKKYTTKQRALQFVFTYQVDRVKHLNFPYRSTAWVCQVTVIIADGKGTQSWRNMCTNRNLWTKTDKTDHRRIYFKSLYDLNKTEMKITNHLHSKTAKIKYLK